MRDQHMRKVRLACGGVSRYRDRQPFMPVAAFALIMLLTATAPGVAMGARDYGGYGETSGQSLVTVTFRIEGIKGPSAAFVLESAVESMDGVHSAEVSYDARRATVEVDSAAINAGLLAGRMQELGAFTVDTLPPYARSATIRIPELETRQAGDQVNTALATVSGVLGGTIRPGFVTVDYNRRVVDAQEIADRISDETSLGASAVLSPASDRVAGKNSAQVILHIPDMTDFRDAMKIAQSVRLQGIVDGSVNLGEQTVTFIYLIGETTSSKIAEAVSGVITGKPEIITIDKAGKPAGLNVHGWFVLAVSALGATVLLGLYFLIRRYRAYRRV